MSVLIIKKQSLLNISSCLLIPSNFQCVCFRTFPDFAERQLEFDYWFQSYLAYKFSFTLLVIYMVAEKNEYACLNKNPLKRKEVIS